MKYESYVCPQCGETFPLDKIQMIAGERAVTTQTHECGPKFNKGVMKLNTENFTQEEKEFVTALAGIPKGGE